MRPPALFLCLFWLLPAPGGGQFGQLGGFGSSSNGPLLNNPFLAKNGPSGELAQQLCLPAGNELLQQQPHQQQQQQPIQQFAIMPADMQQREERCGEGRGWGRGEIRG